MSTARPLGNLRSVIFRLQRTKLGKLKRLSQRTRIRQSEYLREAIDDLLEKYARAEREALRVQHIKEAHARRKEAATP